MKILVAIDGSQPSLKALQAAVGLAEQFAQPAALTLINVHNDAFVRRHQNRFGKQAVDEYLAELHGDDLREASALLQARGVRHEAVRGEGDLAGTIAAHAAANGFDLIVLGSRGRSGLTNLVMGSVATKVLASAKVPVLVVP